MISSKSHILELPVREAISYEFDDFRLNVKRQELQKNGEPVALTNKAYQVLLILVQNFGQTVEKEYIYDQLWGDSFVEDANLTQHIYVLRKTLGPAPSGESYIETVARTGYRFTANVNTVFSPVISSTIFRQRSSAEPALELEKDIPAEPRLRLAEVKPEPGSLIVDEPYVEPTKPLPSTGTKDRNVKILVAGLGLLVLVVMSIAYFIRGPASTSTPTHVRSLAVLPFRTIGDQSKTDQLGLGMADSIIAHLSKLQHIPVRPTSSVIRYIDAPQVNSVSAGRELGVETVLEGTVQRDNERIRVTVQLTDVSDGKSIWADNFDESFNGIFAIQDSISQKVVRALAVNLTTQQEKLMSSGSTTNLEALKVYQMGVYLHSTRSKENLAKAEEYFKTAIQFDPKFAKAYAMLADTYNMQRYYRFADPSETRAKGLDAATKAMELDASTPEAYIALANLQFGGREGMAGAKRLLEKAIELSPYNSTARLRYAWVIVQSDLKAAVEQMRLAQEFDPVSSITNGAYCNMLIFERKFHEAVRYCEKARDISPGTTNTKMLLADAYFLAGRHADAVSTIQNVIDHTADREQFTAMGSLAFYYLRMGRRKEADPIIGRLRAEAEKGPDVLPDMVILSYEIGRRDEALKYFEKALDQQRISIAMLNYSPVWERVNADPAVSEIMNRPRPSQ